MGQMLAPFTRLGLPEKADRGNMEKPLCTVNLKAAQRLSSTGLRDEKRGLEGSCLAWKCA